MNEGEGLEWFGLEPDEAESVSYWERPLFESFVRFARGHLESGDIDPTYPVLKEVYRRRGYSRERALWHTVLYVTFYHLGSAEEALSRYPDPPASFGAPLTLPTGVERRSFRGNDLARVFLADLLREAGGTLAPWVSGLVGPKGGEAGWDRVREGFRRVRYAGPWAAYKWADLLAHVHDYPLSASDLGVGGNSESAGPIPGMVRLTGEGWKRCATDLPFQRELLDRSREAGVPFSGLDQLETALCDFNSLCKGGYYLGHDIDAQAAHLTGDPAHPGRFADYWAARREVFAPKYLGEVGGWSGVRKELKGRFAAYGEIVNL